MKHEESKLQIQCVNWFQYQYKPPKYFIYAIPNAGKRGGRLGGIMKAEGLTAGVCDLHIPISRNGYSSLYIEMKLPDEDLNPNQKKIVPILKNLGNKVVICRSLDEFMHEVNTYFTT